MVKVVNFTLLTFYHNLKNLKRNQINTPSNQKKQNKIKPALFLSISPNEKDMSLALPFRGPCQIHEHTLLPTWINLPALRAFSPGLEILGNLFLFFLKRGRFRGQAGGTGRREAF